MIKDTNDSRLDGRKAYFFRGDLYKPTYYRDPEHVGNTLLLYGLTREKYGNLVTDCLVDEYMFNATYVGMMSIYTFNMQILNYPWMKVFYERKREGQKMTRADWLASGIEMSEQLSLWN
jgi:hypothetical protein